MKRHKPYEVAQGEGGKFVAAGDEPIDSPAIALRTTQSQYAQLEAFAGKKKAQFIRDAIAHYLNFLEEKSPQIGGDELEQRQLDGTRGGEDSRGRAEPTSRTRKRSESPARRNTRMRKDQTGDAQTKSKGE